MHRLLLVLAVAPAFALLLAAVIGLTVRRLLPGDRRTVVRAAPALYAGTVLAAAVTAGALAGFDPVRLGLWELEGTAGGWVLAGAVCCGLVAGAAGYFAELFLADRRTERSGGRGSGVGSAAGTRSVGTRSVGAWASSPPVLLALGLTTGLAEEVLFRGYLLTGLRDDLPLWGALAVQAVLFGAHHASFGLRAVPAKIGHGAVWGLLAVWAGSLLPAVAAHLVFQYLVCRRLTRRSPDAAPDAARETTGEGGACDDPAHGTAAV